MRSLYNALAMYETLIAHLQPKYGLFVKIVVISVVTQTEWMTLKYYFLVQAFEFQNWRTKNTPEKGLYLVRQEEVHLWIFAYWVTSQHT